MAHSNSPAPCETFALQNGAYAQYIDTLKRAGWEEAEWMCKTILEGVQDAKRAIYHEARAIRPTAMIIDVNVDKTVSEPIEVWDRDLFPTATRSPNNITAFTRRLRLVDPNVHTRVVAFTAHEGRSQIPNDSLRKLFTSHILGYELGIRPGLLRQLFDDDLPFAGVKKLNGITLFDPGAAGWLALWLDPGAVANGGAYFQVFLCMYDKFCQDVEAAKKLIWDKLVPTPPTPEKVVNAGASIGLQHIPRSPSHAIFLFYSMICHDVNDKDTTLTPRVPWLGWLSTATRLSADLRLAKVQTLSDRVKKEFTVELMAEVQGEIFQLSGDLMFCKSTLMAFLKDFAEHSTRVVQHEIGNIDTLTEFLGWIHSFTQTQREIELDKKSAQDSQRIVTLTLLAFAIVPINLASSIFGMNVQQINSTGHNIWLFVVTATVLLIVAGSSIPLTRLVSRSLQHGMLRRWMSKMPWR